MPHAIWPIARTEIVALSPGERPDSACNVPKIPLEGVVNQPPFILTSYACTPNVLGQKKLRDVFVALPQFTVGVGNESIIVV